jgi:hypothetical protein
MIRFAHRDSVRTLLLLLRQVPDELIVVPFADYTPIPILPSYQTTLPARMFSRTFELPGSISGQKNGRAQQYLRPQPLRRCYSGRRTDVRQPERLDRQHLGDYIDEAERLGVIVKAMADQARLATDARNLIHAGKMARTGLTCTKATALTALAALEAVLGHLR